MKLSMETKLDIFPRIYDLSGEAVAIENNQIRMEKEIKEPVKEVQERTDREIQEFLDNHTDEDWDDHFQNGGGHDSI